MTDNEYADALLAAALEYVEAGLYVFPARVERLPSGKKSSTFHPAWRDNSTNSAEQVRAWWGPKGSWRGAHICLDCGRSGLVVVDADGQEGLTSLATLDLPPTLRARTPTGGRHVYFQENPAKVVGNTARTVAPGIDTRGLGGLVFAAPSRDAAGAYEWLDGDGLDDPTSLPVVPDVITDRCRNDSQVTQVVTENSGIAAQQVGTGRAQVEPFDLPPRQFTEGQAVTFCKPYLDALRSSTPGEINVRLNDAAKVLSHFIGPFWSEQDARTWLHNALKPTAYDAATWKADDTITSAFRSASRDWRAELVTDPFGVSASEGTGAAPASLLIYDANALEEIPKPKPLIEDVLDVATVSMVAGKFGTYKTFLALSWAAHVASGRAWAGHSVPTAVPVIYVYAEGVYGARSRVQGWKEGFGQLADGSLFIVPRAVPINSPEAMTLLDEKIKELGAGLVVFDTLSRCAPGVDHDKQKEMGPVINRAIGVRDDHGCSVVLVHHTGHAGERARGSSVNEDDIDSSFVIKLEGDEEDRGPNNPRVLYHRKRKDGELFEPVQLRLIESESGAYVDVDPFSGAGRRSSSGPGTGQVDAGAVVGYIRDNPGVSGYKIREALQWDARRLNRAIGAAGTLVRFELGARGAQLWHLVTESTDVDGS